MEERPHRGGDFDQKLETVFLAGDRKCHGLQVGTLSAPHKLRIVIGIVTARGATLGVPPPCRDTGPLCSPPGCGASFLGFRGRAGGPWSWPREEEEDV